jgi:hypothetical protein
MSTLPDLLGNAGGVLSLYACMSLLGLLELTELHTRRRMCADALCPVWYR